VEEIKLAIKYMDCAFDIFDIDEDLDSSSDYKIVESLNDPMIEKLVRQQEKTNRFSDIFNKPLKNEI
jgi:hypothetical protein